MSSSQARRFRREGREPVDPERTMGKRGAGSGPNGASTMPPPEDIKRITREWDNRISLLHITAGCPRGGITSPTASTAGGLGHLG